MSAILRNVLALRRGEFIRLACEDGRMNSPLRQSDRAKSVSDRIRISERSDTVPIDKHDHLFGRYRPSALRKLL